MDSQMEEIYSGRCRRKDMELSRPSVSIPIPPGTSMYRVMEASETSPFGFLWKLHCMGMIDQIIGYL